jgi:hypothetical protein
VTEEEKAEVVYKLLKKSVPPTAVAHALDMDPDTVKGVLAQIRVEDYGTDEIAEAMTYLIWVAYETALHEIQFGTPASKARFIQLVLARSIGLAGKSTPETSERIRAALEGMAADMAPKIQLAPSIYTPGE